MIYVALLRGVNVGGNHRVPKADLQAVLEGLRFRNVRIYLNSGNAVFTSNDRVEAATVQRALEYCFGFAIPTLILPGDKIQRIAEMIPTDWTNDSPRPDKTGQKSDVLYLFNDINSPSILNKIGYNSEIEKMIYTDGAIITNISRANQSKGSLQKLIGSSLYSNITIRNINTAKKLAELTKT